MSLVPIYPLITTTLAAISSECQQDLLILSLQWPLSLYLPVLAAVIQRNQRLPRAADQGRSGEIFLPIVASRALPILLNSRDHPHPSSSHPLIIQCYHLISPLPAILMISSRRLGPMPCPAVITHSWISDRKKVIVGGITLVLQTAAEALKLAPVPGLDAIPNLLLTWLQVYETVGGNDDDLKGLDEDIQRAYVTILQPLELLTDQIPREVVQLIKRFHLALKKQINEMELLKSQNRVKRMFLAREIAKRINGVKACINDALNSFATQATTLTLLRTIEASVQSFSKA
ncbi:uncharacterized protein EI90DRAFT_2566512 [Cantharellus anzutake]|uniref:uncharacterized protein n=1 Tax=Cantharellus anzutake TaxID=1750568 RepID=UPI0019039EEF|nr:uncharacterized protein EI90DRAFT_2566512 [Cantharellus anzutake]KAF8338245.1 hypothetical protein EI90DRAFT_2566512 [Cantharellus anzutake]